MSRSKAYNSDEVLEKAMHVFWKNGYEATSVRVLEEEMGINQFSIYSSFHNKKNLFIQSLQNYKEYVKYNRFQILLKNNAGLQELELFFVGYVKKVTLGNFANGCLIVNTVGEVVVKDKLVNKEINNYFSFIKSMFYNLLENAIKRGEINKHTNLEKYSSYLLNVMQGLAVGAKVLPEEQISDIIEIAISTLKK